MMEKEEMHNDVFSNALKQLDKAQAVRKWDEKELNLIKQHKLILSAKLKIKLDNGKTKKFYAYRIQHNNARGPTKGGIRYHPNVTQQEIKALSFWMSLKCAVTGIPYGGAKGGIQVTPQELSQAELERLSRAFIEAFHKYIGPDKDIPAPDVYTDGKIMAWMLDEYEKIYQGHYPAMITGKPLELGGSLGRDIATAQGGIYVLHDALKSFKMQNNSRVVVQGFGNAGANAARILSRMGFKIIAVSDSKGGIFNDKGLDIEQVLAHKALTKSVTGFGGAKAVSNNELLELETEILIPAALENQITKDNADKIKAKIIIELANGPITPEADDILFKKDIKVIPDILANAGGVVVSYFEWVQNREGYYWKEKLVLERLEEIMKNAFEDVFSASKKFNTDMRTAAQIVAVDKILAAEKLRGNLK